MTTEITSRSFSGTSVESVLTILVELLDGASKSSEHDHLEAMIFALSKHFQSLLEVEGLESGQVMELILLRDRVYEIWKSIHTPNELKFLGDDIIP